MEYIRESRRPPGRPKGGVRGAEPPRETKINNCFWWQVSQGVWIIGPAEHQACHIHNLFHKVLFILAKACGSAKCNSYDVHAIWKCWSLGPRQGHQSTCMWESFEFHLIFIVQSVRTLSSITVYECHTIFIFGPWLPAHGLSITWLLQIRYMWNPLPAPPN